MFSGNWQGSQNIHSEVQRLLTYLSSSKPPSVRFALPWEPAVDVYETETEVVVTLELAGVKKDEIEIAIGDNNMLFIRGQRQESKSRSSRRRYYQLEIHRGPFQRRIPLPSPVDADRAEATREDGILQISLPKVKPAQLHIEIKTFRKLEQ